MSLRGLALPGCWVQTSVWLLYLSVSGSLGSAVAELAPATSIPSPPPYVEAVRSVLSANRPAGDAIRMLETAVLTGGAGAPDAYFYLGKIAQHEGRFVDAADYFQRWRSLGGATAGDPRNQIYSAFFNEHREPTILVEVWTDAALDTANPRSSLRVDGRFVAPLPAEGLQLLLPAGDADHVFEVVRGNVILRAKREQLASRGISRVKLHQQGDELVVAKTHSIGVSLVLASGILSSQKDAIVRTVTEALTRTSAMLQPSAPKTQAAESLRDASCLTPLARTGYDGGTSDFEELVRLDAVEHVGAARPEIRLSARVYDLYQGAVAAVLPEPQSEPIANYTCTSCTPEKLAALSAKLVVESIKTSHNRGRAELSVNSTPEGALVHINGCPRGKTPTKLRIFPSPENGTIQVRLERRGHAQQQQDVQISAWKSKTLPLIALKRTSLPTYRNVLGGALLAAGGVLLGFGGAALYTDGRCYVMPDVSQGCAIYYDLTALGGSLIGVGSGLALGGILTMVIPSR